ncbi:MAG: peptidoglycan DD-metalloendopeptidase family protein [Candidatus Paceibacterota bacterium]|jgi:murein DD-endopeptidase MepM/ murein hydrolase activator NlpD
MKYKFVIIYFLLILALTPLASTVAQTADLQSKIDDKTAQLKKLDSEIKAASSLAANAGKEATTLKKTLAGLDASRKALEQQITTAKKQIGATQGTIKNLNVSIQATTKQLELRRNMVGETVRILAETESASPVAVFLGYDSMGAYWAYEQGVEQIQKNLTARIIEAKQTKESLDQNKTIQEREKARLTDYSEQVQDKKKIAEATSQEKKALLDVTKSKEATYQKLLLEKKKEREAVEAELLDYEARLSFTLDPSSIPKAGTKVFKWPTQGGVITQLFGNTAFSRTTTAYNGKGHNGIDIGVPIGTPVYAAADAVVRGFGNTDLNCKGASYGKWILLDHAMNMSTLYGHMSLISVTEGQLIKAGDRIGYSGNTGYSTGPHIHFSLFAKASVNISKLQSRVRSCGAYTLPVASFSGYLNPTSYLQML